MLAPRPANSCGAVIEIAEVKATGPGGEIVLLDGRRTRLGGLALAPNAGQALQRLAGQRVGVARLARSPDRWGRTIVDLIDPDGQSVALDLIVQGLARVRPEPETRACEPDRIEAEEAARAAGEGLWARADAILRADDPAALAQADGRFVLVEGVVRRVGGTRAKIYLDFGGRDGFSVVVARKAESLFRRSGVDLPSLKGRRALVRGVMDARFAPRIEIADPAMIEPLQSASRRG